MDEDIKLACETLRKGGVILYPTDTVWGIGCDAIQSNVVKRVFEIKRRADNKALIVMLGDEQLLELYVDEVPEIAYDLIDAAVKPLTIVYDGGCNLAPELLGEDGSVGIRITKENFSSRLCRAYRKPIVSTSANISGEPTPAIFDEISENIKNSVDYIVETRRDDNEPHLPSSVIKLGVGGTIKIIRN
ncbi:MAG: threonylcarbamoyl-AMP synthase [Muribaculaceae bacterium]|nr:threonylcarbamoyl-AMP synthase [Muribaculaceae bacterium]